MKNVKTLRRTVFIIFTLILVLVLCSLTVMADDSAVSDCEEQKTDEDTLSGNELLFFEEFMVTPYFGYTDEEIREMELKAELERKALEEYWFEKKTIHDVDLKNADPKDTSVFKYSEEAAKIIDESKLTLIVPQQTFQCWSILGYIDFDEMVFDIVKIVTNKQNWTVDDFYHCPWFYPEYLCLDKENHISRIIFKEESNQYEVFWTTSKRIEEFSDSLDDFLCNIFRDCVALGMEHAQYYVLSSVNNIDVYNYFPTYELPDKSYPVYVFATNDEKTVALEYGRENKDAHYSENWLYFDEFKLDRTLEFDEVKKLFDSYYNYNLEKGRNNVDGGRFRFQYFLPAEWFDEEYYIATEERIKEYEEFLQKMKEAGPYGLCGGGSGSSSDADVKDAVDNTVIEKVSAPLENEVKENEVKIEKAPLEAAAAVLDPEANESNAGKTAFIISAITLFVVSLAISAVILVKKKNHS